MHQGFMQFSLFPSPVVKGGVNLGLDFWQKRGGLTGSADGLC